MIRTLRHTQGFTLIETLVAISILAVSIVAPMNLVGQSLTAAYYARDEITGYNLAQEGLEATRQLRDNAVLERAINGSAVDLLGVIPNGVPFIIDATDGKIWKQADLSCPISSVYLKIDPSGSLYGYGQNPCVLNGTDGWTPTHFRRTLTATYVGPATINGGKDEIQISSSVQWLSALGKPLAPFVIRENLYRWIDDGTITP